MAQPVIWSDESLSNIEGIAEYIARDSLYYAHMWKRVHLAIN